MKIISSLIEYIFPSRCLGCRKFGVILCDNCIQDFHEARSPEDSFIFACFSYKNSTLKRALWHLKYHGKFTIAHILGHILHERTLDILSEKKLFGLDGGVLVVPIPITKKRKRHRGYNQSALLARAFVKASESEFIYGDEIIEKSIDTIAQAKMHNRNERLSNLKGAYRLKHGVNIKGKNIILIDDVSTTGATLKEARRVLRNGGARNIIALVVAH